MAGGVLATTTHELRPSPAQPQALGAATWRRAASERRRQKPGGRRPLRAHPASRIMVRRGADRPLQTRPYIPRCARTTGSGQRPASAWSPPGAYRRGDLRHLDRAGPAPVTATPSTARPRIGPPYHPAPHRLVWLSKGDDQGYYVASLQRRPVASLPHRAYPPDLPRADWD